MLIRRPLQILAAAAAAALAVFIVLSLLHRETGPEKTVRDSLGKLQALDGGQISDLFSLSAAETASQGASSQDLPEYASEAIQLFFRDFSFHIVSSTRQDSIAQVTVRATNMDSRELARAIRRLELENSLRSTQEGQPSGAGSSVNVFSLMKTVLSTQSIPLSSSEETLTLDKTQDGWAVRSDDALKRLLTGGLADSLSDPYLLSPEETLSIYLDQYKTMTVDEWKSRFQAEDLLRASASDYPVDDTYISLIMKYYDYQIDDIRTENSIAEADVTVTSVDMTAVLLSFREKLISYARQAESLSQDSITLTSASASLLMDAFSESAAPGTSKITGRLENDGTSWQLTDTSGLANALLGDIAGAIDAFNSSE